MPTATQALPESTYRLQFHAGFTFKDATAIVPYIASLGVTHLYASPYLRATPGSTHGYDVIDHNSLNPEVGTDADFAELCAALAKYNISQILDIVPNHVGIATNENVWWNDVLRNGPDSPHGKFFDIAWEGSPRAYLRGKVLLPLLGRPYDEVLSGGQLTLSHDGEGFWVNYYDRRFPISPRTLSLKSGEDVAKVIARYAGKKGDAASFDALHDLLEQQYYRLAFWKAAPDEINYRRFFDVNDLAAIAMERQEVFDAAHKLVFELIKAGHVTGLRLDHPDGLYDPKTYFERLQTRYRETVGNTAGTGDKNRPLYLLAEKILAPDETLPREWAVHGTSGYDFLNVANGLFVDAKAEPMLTKTYVDWLGCGASTVEVSYENLAYEKKKLILTISLASELNMLTGRLDRLAQKNRAWRDNTLTGLLNALKEVVACFGVYRTYIDSPTITPRDLAQVEKAINAAIERNPKTDVSVFHFIRDALLQRYPAHFSDADRAEQLAFAGKFQQLTSPATAKGIEDTAFYLYNRSVSLNEVGGEPAHFGLSPAKVHAYFAERQRDWPFTMSSLSTHDTKRHADVRARLNVLSELPGDWQQHVERWRELARPLRATLHDGPATDESPAVAPSPNDEFALYQALVGAWPLHEDNVDRGVFADRMVAYMQKVMREGKVHTSWTAPNEAYESGVEQMVRALIDEKTGGAFQADFLPFAKRVARVGLVNSLSQQLVKLAAPGVPDTYQGDDMLDFSLVDPDNRRPVDFDRRQAALAAIVAAAARGADGLKAAAAEAARSLKDGRGKLLVHWATLNTRRRHPGLLTSGAYIPLAASGARAANVFAFARHADNVAAVAIVPRLVASITPGDDDDQPPLGRDAWGDTMIALSPDLRRRTLKNAFTGETVTPGADGTIALADVLATFPVALLLAE